MKTKPFYQVKIICLAFALLISYVNSSLGQENQEITDKESEAIIHVVSLLEDAIKKSDPSILKTHLSTEFSCMGYEAPMAESHVLPQVLQQMPKGKVEVVNTLKKDGIYHLDITITPMQVPLIIEINEQFKILNIKQRSENPSPPKAQGGSEKKKKRISIPFHLIDGFILIDTEINGKKGKLMFDTGNPNKLLLNNNYLELNKKEKVGSGQVGSGQNIEIYTDEVKRVSFGLNFSMGPQTIQHADFGFTQIGITPDMMGFLGYEFMQDYEFMIDYDDQIIEMYLISDNDKNKIYKEDEVVVELDFSTPFMPNIPYVDFESKGQKIKANFDTGNQGHLDLDASKTKTLIQAGIINEVQSNGIYGQPAITTKYSIDDLRYKDIKLKKIKSMMNHVASGMPVTKESEYDFGVGYQFLKNYRSVWNFKTKKIILLNR